MIAFADPWRGFKKYSEWRPIGEDTYSQDEVNAWFMNYKPGAKATQELATRTSPRPAPGLATAANLEVSRRPNPLKAAVRALGDEVRVRRT